MDIKITCKGTKYLPIDGLQAFQGNLKDLRAEELEKLKRSILRYGFSFPVFVWGDKILDGHQRVFAVRELLKEKHTIGKIPVVEIEAENETEAAEKLLILNSRYARITDEGLYEFLSNHSVDLTGIKDDLVLPEIDLDRFISGWSEETSQTVSPENNYAAQYGVIVICESESNQAEVYNKLKGEGFNCRVVNT